MDGRLRIYASDNGEVLWELNTVQDFNTVSGEKARGGSFSGGGAIVADGMIYVNSGYGIYNHMPGNLLLAIESNPNHPIAHNELGIVYRESGRFT